MKGLIKKYNRQLSEFKETASNIGELICQALMPIIPDIRYSLGGHESGVDKICFWSEMHGAGAHSYTHWDLDCTLPEVFPEIKNNFETPVGLYLSKDEAQKAREALLQLKHKIISEEVKK